MGFKAWWNEKDKSFQIGILSLAISVLLMNIIHYCSLYGSRVWGNKVVLIILALSALIGLGCLFYDARERLKKNFSIAISKAILGILAGLFLSIFWLYVPLINALGGVMNGILDCEGRACFLPGFIMSTSIFAIIGLFAGAYKDSKITKIFLAIFKASLTLFVIYTLVFGLIRPVSSMITQDRPIIKKLCEIQVKCHTNSVKYPCSYNTEMEDSASSKLISWSGYNGCNESTEGYGVDDDTSYISVEVCGCGAYG